MSRVTADRACGKCGWKGTHIPEDVPYICPECNEDISGKPIPFDYDAYLRRKQEEEVTKGVDAPIVRK